MKNILIAIDFNKNEVRLIEKALEIARAFGSKIWLIHVAPPDPDFVGYDIGPQYIRDTLSTVIRKEHKLLQGFASNIKVSGIEAEAIFIQGSTIDMIIEETTKLNIDLIIAGHHEHGFIYRTFAESVSNGVLEKSKIPVLIVPLD